MSGKTKSCPKVPRGEEPDVLREVILPEKLCGYRARSWFEWAEPGSGRAVETTGPGKEV